MSEEERDPPRLSGALMDAGRRDLPNDAQMMALAAKLGVLAGAAGGGGAALGGASAAKAAAGAGGASAGAGVGSGAGAGAGAGAGVGAAGAKAGAVGAATVAAKGAGAGLAIKIVGAFVVAGAIAGGTAAEVSHVSHARQAAAIAASASAARIAMNANPAQKPVNSLNPRPAQDPVPEEEPTPLPSASASVAAPISKPDMSAAPDPAEEVKLLERAQDALRSRPADALALCNEHRAKFPRGSLAQEREVIAVEALVDLGRADAAKARADRFQAAYPTSTHVRRVRELVGEN